MAAAPEVGEPGKTMTRGIYQPPEYRTGTAERAVERLKSLQAGEAAVLEAVACGQAIVPELLSFGVQF
jgi:hypothetical protein